MAKTLLTAVAIAIMLSALLLPFSFWKHSRMPEPLQWDRTPGYSVADTRFDCHYIDTCRASKLASINVFTNALVLLPFVAVAVGILQRVEVSAFMKRLLSIFVLSLGAIAISYALLSAYGFIADEWYYHDSLSTDPYIWLASMPAFIFGALATILGYGGYRKASCQDEQDSSGGAGGAV